MEPKAIALTITFAAVAIALNPVKIPTIFWVNNYFQFSQIPIVVAFLLLGVKTGVFVGFLNLLGGLALFPLGASGLIVYPMDFVSLMIMFAGLYAAITLKRRKDKAETSLTGKKSLIGMVALGTTFRGGIMPVMDFVVLYHVLLPLIIGVNLPEAFIVGMVPLFVLYNVIVALYTVSIACIVAKKVGAYLKVESPIPERVH